MNDIGERFAKLVRQSRSNVVLRPQPTWTDTELPGLTKARALDVATLRCLWDSFDGVCGTSDPDISIEAVHYVLNEKGDGAYCAV